MLTKNQNPIRVIILTLAIFSCLISMPSCVGLKCFDPEFNSLTLYDYELRNETSVTIAKYKNATEFIDSNNFILDTLHFIRNINYTFSEGYEYKVRLYPSGKVYTIKNITITTDEHGQGGIGEHKKCVNGFSYYINDSLITQKVQTGISSNTSDSKNKTITL